ncbi:hypothetical protein PGTUg99_033549 [Puccinia graminis f. sp. tritici]|uniref:DUF7143 domain-containing protein n=1 Tax=Puccinia graminis f. sp. tritici TaxID=56615 RepID=A0A5B0SNL4_PUCGR|nr:hypothetical protein PGTUg99_033549 [Puccinia graminis f. sp. tritici]
MKTSSLSIDRFSEVSCLDHAIQPVPGIPDLILNGITYSSIDFQVSLDHKSSVGFAIDKFIFELEHKAAFERVSNTEVGSLVEHREDDTKEPKMDAEERKQRARSEILLLTTYWKLYGAMDIALRVLNNQSAAKILSLLKGPGFVLNFQRARLEGKVKEIGFYLIQILKNCFNCTGIERKRLILLARASGVTNQSISEAEALANSSNKTQSPTALTSGSGQSQRLLKGLWHTHAYFIFTFSLLLILCFHSINDAILHVCSMNPYQLLAEQRGI